MKCDVIAAGIVNAAKGVGFHLLPSNISSVLHASPVALPRTCAVSWAALEGRSWVMEYATGRVSSLPREILQWIFLAESFVLKDESTALGMQVGVQVPLIVRLEGTNVEKGKEILSNSDVTIITAEDLDDAATKAVKSIQ